MNHLNSQQNDIDRVQHAERATSLARMGIASCLVLATIGCATAPSAVSSKPGTTFGQIYVDTPEVYSRERLVNDRFQQDAWLREKLRENPAQGLQGAVGSSARTSTDLSLGVGTKPQAASAAQAEKAATPQDIADTPIEQLRDTMAYREEVRNEILENQLDDRHDIAGNTLYRLKFDTTIVPLQDTSAYAMVEVTIKGSEYWDMGGVYAEVQYPEDGQQESIAIPDYDFARYVSGLDTETLEFYEQMYAVWVRDIDPDKRSSEEILYGRLQAYFDLDEGSGGLQAKTNCEYYEDEAQQRAAQRVLEQRGVPGEYLEAGLLVQVFSYEDEWGDEIEEILTTPRLCVKTGLANFIADLKGHNTAVYTYAVTPKERVQRVYGNSLDAGSVGVSIGAEQEGIGAALAHSSAREARANAIMRQPQIVGYSPDAHEKSEATMGWLIGPRYKISADPEGLVSFRHVPSQHTLTGIVSVPSWWQELTLVTRTYWLDESGVKYTQAGEKLVAGTDAETGYEVRITLPADVTSIDTMFDPERREPRIDASTENDGQDQLRACEKGSVIIRGSQLWRSTVVTLGGQQADSIMVLPNMKGIIATFNRVEPSISGSEPLNLWTSEGEAFVRTMTINGGCEGNPAT